MPAVRWEGETAGGVVLIQLLLLVVASPEEERAAEEKHADDSDASADSGGGATAKSALVWGGDEVAGVGRCGAGCYWRAREDGFYDFCDFGVAVVVRNRGGLGDCHLCLGAFGC